MLRLLADENFNGHITRGLLHQRPQIVVVRVQDVGLAEADDPTILAWAAENDYILVTHDQATIPEFAYDRLLTGQPMAGVFILSDRLAVRQAIEEILLLDDCSEQYEWQNLIVYLPLD